MTLSTESNYGSPKNTNNVLFRTNKVVLIFHVFTRDKIYEFPHRGYIFPYMLSLSLYIGCNLQISHRWLILPYILLLCIYKGCNLWISCKGLIFPYIWLLYIYIYIYTHIECNLRISLRGLIISIYIHSTNYEMSHRVLICYIFTKSISYRTSHRMSISLHIYLECDLGNFPHMVYIYIYIHRR